MKKRLLFLMLCISLLLSGCQKTPEAPPAVQAEDAPWETGLPDAQPSYAEYFAQTRTYDTADYAYSPAWLQTGAYEIDCKDGKLALYRASDGEQLAVYAEQPFLSWRTGSDSVYVFREQDILCCSYDGSQTKTLYAAQDGTIICFAAAGDVLFFAEKTAYHIRLCRLYAPEERLDVLYDAVSPDAERFLLFPISNHELRWSMVNPAFLKLAAEQKQTYLETRNLDPDDQDTYWGMLELDFDVNSGIWYYYNDLTQELRSQEFQIVYGEEDGADWWKTAEAHTERLGFAGANIGQGGLMAGDGEWIYYRSERDWGLYKARTNGSEQTQLLPPEEYAPHSINVLGDWVYFSNFLDGFSLWRVRTDGSEAEKLVDGYCYTFLVAESGIYFDCRDENNVMRTFHAELDGSAQTLLYESCAPCAYYDDTLYLYDFRSGTLYAYGTKAKEREILFEGKYNAAYFSVDDTGIYFWDDMCDYCHLDPKTKKITVLYKGPIGDYFNYYDGTVYYVAYGGENYDYDCCYAMDVKTGEQKAILSLSPEMYDAFGDPIGITQVDYRDGNYDADSIPTNEEGWPMALNELVDGLFVVNGQVFARGRLARAGMAETWILCDGENGIVWTEG